MRYLLLAYVDEKAMGISPEEDAEMERKIVSWVRETTDRGVRLMGSLLCLEDEAATLRLSGGELMISDGPFAETKEQLAGFEVLECSNIDEAIEVASRHPGMENGVVELRPLLWDLRTFGAYGLLSVIGNESRRAVLKVASLLNVNGEFRRQQVRGPGRRVISGHLKQVRPRRC